jgi:hypothetical protein
LDILDISVILDIIAMLFPSIRIAICFPFMRIAVFLAFFMRMILFSERRFLRSYCAVGDPNGTGTTANPAGAGAPRAHRGGRPAQSGWGPDGLRRRHEITPGSLLQEADVLARRWAICALASASAFADYGEGLRRLRT